MAMPMASSQVQTPPGYGASIPQDPLSGRFFEEQELGMTTRSRTACDGGLTSVVKSFCVLKEARNEAPVIARGTGQAIVECPASVRPSTSCNQPAGGLQRARVRPAQQRPNHIAYWI
eukprot:6199673-Pleurochrysis_carterae.AAC.1